MLIDRFASITGRYAKLRIALVGDFCLDRYLEIDPDKKETSLETGLPVYNVTKVRAQPGGAGTILNNLSALEIGTIYPVGFCGLDGEGYELCQAMAALPGVCLDYFLQSPARRTFTYCKPLLLHPKRPPQELNRLDSKNWTPTPADLQRLLAENVRRLAGHVDAFILLSQVDHPETGVVTQSLLKTIGPLAAAHPQTLVLADSRCGFAGYPPIGLKMNLIEFMVFSGLQGKLGLPELCRAAAAHARKRNNYLFITLAAKGLVGASPNGNVAHLPSLRLRGKIDIVGAGDAVTANLVSALTAGAELREALELANAAASIVVHQLGTTGTASVAQIKGLIV